MGGTVFKLTINSNSFDDNYIEAIKNFFYGNQFKKITENLNLESLEEIIITMDFDTAISEVSKRYEIQNHGHTNNQYASAIGKVIHSKYEDKNFRQVVLYKEDVVLELFNSENADFAFHYIYHELCHVDDHVRQKDIFSHEARIKIRENDYLNALYVEALSLWSEYTVVRKSVVSLKLNFLMDVLSIDALNEIVENVEVEVKEAINKYRFNSDISLLYDLINKRCNLILRLLVTNIAYVNELNFNLEQKIEFKKSFKIEIIRELWDIAELPLNELYNSYPHWNDLYELQTLFKIIQRLWGYMGIEPRDNGNGQMYVSVP